MKWLSRFVLWSSLTLLLGSSMTSYIDPNIIPYWNILSVLHPWIYLGLVFLLMIFVLQGSKNSWWLMAGLLLALPTMARFLQSPKKYDPQEAQLSLMSYNLGAFVPSSTKETSYASFKENLRWANPDVFCSQETFGEVRRQLLEFAGFPHTYSGERSTGPLILSRYPILYQGELAFDSKVNACIWVDVATATDTIRVYNVHFQSARISQEADELISGSLRTHQETLSSSKFIVKNFLRTSKIRAQEATLLLQHAENCPYPSYIVGDFNETAYSHVYHLLKKGRKDSFVAGGRGISATYRGKIPALRIDHILVPLGHSTINHSVHPWTYSDHRPVQVLVKLEDASKNITPKD